MNILNNGTRVRILAFLLISTLMPAFHWHTLKPDENLGAIPQSSHQPVQNVTFFLLGIEQYANQVSLTSAQELIKTLRLFKNWKNGTISEGFQFFNHIHLLSNVPILDIDSECQAFYRGNATKANVMKEISTFLNQRSPMENYTVSIRILYYIGETSKAVINGSSSYYMALDKPIYDWELHKVLQSNESNSSNMLIILDTCYSGGYLSKLKQHGRVILTSCNPIETANRWISLQNPELKNEGWFTGQETTSFRNGTYFGPLGIVGGILNATDINKDGWRSANEIFQFAYRTTIWYAANQTDPETQSPYSQNPWAIYGVAGGEIPIVQYKESKPFPGEARACTPRPMLLSSSRYDYSEFEHRMYRRSLSREGFAPTEGPKSPQILWVSSLNDSVTTSPAVADGMVFVGTLGGGLYALDMATGEVIWMFRADGSISSSPAVMNSIVFFGTEEPGKVYALDSYTGRVRWIYEIPNGGAVYSSPAIFNDKVFIGSSDRYLRCLSQFEGELVWTSYIGGEELSSPAIADNIIFITSPYVYAVDMLTGKLIWKYQTNWAVISSPAVADGLVFVGSKNDDKVFALEQDSGKLVWSFRSGGWFTSPAVDSLKKLLVVGCRDARVYCLDTNRGILQWEYVNGVNYLSAPTISKDGLVYIGSSNGNFYCLDEETGEEIWKHAIGSPIVSAPCLIYEHVFVGSIDGKIHCFGPPFPTHDVRILNVNVSCLNVKKGELVEINYTIENCGTVDEYVVISCGQNSSNVWNAPRYLEPTILRSENVTIASEARFTSTYSWNTSNELPGLYSISIQADLVPDEINASNNAYVVNKVMIIALADLDADGKINIVDLHIVARAYGSTLEDPNWTESADLNRDGIIDIIDMYLIAQDFGEIYV